MLFFGHIGITLGAAALAAHAANGRRETEPQGKTVWFSTLARYADVRLLIVGSILPDIIDKPVGLYFFRETFSNGRIFAHTLLFLLLIAVPGYLLSARRRRRGMLSLAGGILAHLALDKMWQIPGTLFWPLLGLHFESNELEGYIGRLLDALLSSPYIYISEAIGLTVTIWFGIWILRQKKVRAFIRSGKIS